MKVFLIPALADNYMYILRSSDGKTAVVDPSEAAPVERFLKEKNWSLDFILNTHHHWDHTGGNVQLKKTFGSSVVGFGEDARRIPGIDTLLKENEVWNFGQSFCRILFIPGHTLGHIAFWFFEEKILFCGDTLFSMGCGRIFEGDFAQMFGSLRVLSELPEAALIYCGHEYTEKNGEFALKVEGGNADLQKRMKIVLEKRKKQLPTMPFLLADELKTNPFLRCKILTEEAGLITHPVLKQWMKKQKKVTALGLFSELRRLKDHF